MKRTEKTITRLGEFGLIDRLKTILAAPRKSDLIIGIGDDAAAIKIGDNRLLLVTCDIQVEDVHFRSKFLAPYQLGKRAIAVNQSDIAAMGGIPTYALVSASLPENLALNDFNSMFQGMTDQMAEYKGHIIGGNLARCDKKLFIDIFMLGKTNSKNLITRSKARPGNLIFVTGKVGSSSAGFAVLEKYHGSCPKKFSELVLAHQKPQPRVKMGVELAKSGAVTAMIDISDGLAIDLDHICGMSNVGAEIFQNEIPVSDMIEEVAKFRRKDKWDYPLYGGEDYELLFTAKPGREKTIARIAARCKVPVAAIGSILHSGAGLWLVQSDGSRIHLEPRGWNHFSFNKNSR
jgi:thiamine-monophosphate kinase